MIHNKPDLRNLFAQARATHFAMINGALTYKQAKQRVASTLNLINNRIMTIAKKYHVNPRLIKFQDLGRSL